MDRSLFTVLPLIDSVMLELPANIACLAQWVAAARSTVVRVVIWAWWGRPWGPPWLLAVWQRPPRRRGSSTSWAMQLLTLWGVVSSLMIKCFSHSLFTLSHVFAYQQMVILVADQRVTRWRAGISAPRALLAHIVNKGQRWLGHNWILCRKEKFRFVSNIVMAKSS